MLNALALWGPLGCAAGRPAAAPADFPLHASAQGYFQLHWRLDRGDSVTATGVVEVSLPDRIAEVTLELVGLDREGRPVSRGVSDVRPMAFSPERLWPFTVQLRPTGREERFTLQVSDFTWQVLRGGRSR